MKNRILIITSLITAFSFCFTKLQSQVSIGSLSNSLKGTLLDLKENDNAAGEATSTKGMMYPRVALTLPDKLVPMLEGNDLANANPFQYTGLIVYNVTEDTNFRKGFYVWDGAKWNLMQTEEQSAVIVPKAGNGLSISTDSVVLGGSLNRNTEIDLNNYNPVFVNTGNVGIGTTVPTAQLEVNGVIKADSTLSVADTLTSNKKTFLKTANYSGGAPIAQLGVDAATGEVFTVATKSANTAPFNYIKYELTINSTGTNGINTVWVNRYDTKIPASDYTLIVVGSSFTPPGSNQGLQMIQSGYGDFGAQQVYANKTTGTNPTWYLYANFTGARTVNSVAGGKWTFYCIAINNSIVKTFPPPAQPVNMPNGSTTGSGTKPVGL